MQMFYFSSFFVSRNIYCLPFFSITRFTVCGEILMNFDIGLFITDRLLIGAGGLSRLSVSLSLAEVF